MKRYSTLMQNQQENINVKISELRRHNDESLSGDGNSIRKYNHYDQLMQMISHHPNYLEPFFRAHQFILKGDGPLSYACRHYIAIMAAARHQCHYLVNAEREEFILSGGDHSWLKGIQFIPKKLKDLNEINKILAHQPWLLTKAHIEKLTKGSDSWSITELVHAIVILTHFHALSCFVFSCNIYEKSQENDGGDNDNDENEKENGHRKCTNSSSGNVSPSQQLGSSPSSTDTTVEVLMKKMRTISEQYQKMTDDSTVTQEELIKGFDKVEQQSAQLSVPNGNSPPRKSSSQSDKDYDIRDNCDDLSHFVDDAQFSYHDFARRREESDYPTFRIQDYSWDDHGYSLVNRLYNDVGNLLDDKFKVCYNLTYYTMGRKANVDTSMFRRAVWNYIHCMYGIRHDDYDYREVNELLERNLKTYIKILCCFPHRAAKCDLNVMRGFRRSEKIHVNLMIFEARLQAELLYALRAVMRYMT